MRKLKEIAEFLDKSLELDSFKADPSNNGLQFEGNEEIRKAAFAVDACAESFARAAELGADMLFVHHGMSWGSGLKRISGLKARRVSALAKAGISLYAAHLPLDAHPELGHNALLCQLMGVKRKLPFAEYAGSKIGFYGELPKAMPAKKLMAQLDASLPSFGGRAIFGDASRPVKRVGAVSGGGCWPELLEEICSLEIDCLVTGAFEHEAYHPLMESGACVVAMGHYRSETPGVMAVMELVEKKFKIPCEFIDCPTGL